MASSAFPDWIRFAVVQRRKRTGCIPTGYEMLLRAAGVDNIDFGSFQDDFDLDRDLAAGDEPKNSFASVADAVRTKYPHVLFAHVAFEKGRGADKLELVEARIERRQPVLVSLALEPFGVVGWHIMPVVDATRDGLVLLREKKPNGAVETWTVAKAEIVRIHDTYVGGDDVAYLEAAPVSLEQINK